MTTMLEEYTTEEQRSFVRFLWAKGLSVKNIHKEMFLVYGGICLSRKAVYKLVEKMANILLMTKRMKRRWGSA
jgi:hypothetical protein